MRDFEKTVNIQKTYTRGGLIVLWEGAWFVIKEAINVEYYGIYGDLMSSLEAFINANLHNLASIA